MAGHCSSSRKASLAAAGAKSDAHHHTSDRAGATANYESSKSRFEDASYDQALQHPHENWIGQCSHAQISEKKVGSDNAFGRARRVLPEKTGQTIMGCIDVPENEAEKYVVLNRPDLARVPDAQKLWMSPSCHPRLSCTGSLIPWLAFGYGDPPTRSETLHNLMKVGLRKIVRL